jgi:DNA-binding GntR family transcriptional regulator
MTDDPRRYMQIAVYLRQGLSGGRWERGQPVPSITTLSQEFGVNRRTAAKSLALLESEGLLTRYPGLGYYVA